MTTQLEEIVKAEAAPMKRKGGRPPIPSAPLNADECRALIAAEVIRSKPKEHTLRGLFRLLNEYKQHEKSPLELKRLELVEQANRQKQEEIELKKQQAALQAAEYRRRFAGMTHGAKQLLRTIERLEAENAALRLQVATGQKGTHVQSEILTQ
jgi:hypothetical protein